jgi:hypothetical protein
VILDPCSSRGRAARSNRIRGLRNIPFRKRRVVLFRSREKSSMSETLGNGNLKEYRRRNLVIAQRLCTVCTPPHAALLISFKAFWVAHTSGSLARKRLCRGSASEFMKHAPVDKLRHRSAAKQRYHDVNQEGPDGESSNDRVLARHRRRECAARRRGWTVTRRQEGDQARRRARSILRP